jgi:[ribosomal protein S18]-alanine N-acetyltransferase
MVSDGDSQGLPRVGRSLYLRPLRPLELPQALELDRRCLGGLWSESGYLREIESDQSELWVLATDPLQLLALGCLWAILDEAHITLLAVDPRYRQQGLGQYLLWALLQAARQRQLAWAALEVRVSNLLAINLYEKFGFQLIGHRRNYYQDNGEDAAILWLKHLQSETLSQCLQDKAPNLRSRLQQSGWSDPSLDISLEKYFKKS